MSKETEADFYLIELERYKMALMLACKDLPQIFNGKIRLEDAVAFYLECSDYSPELLDILEEKLK